MIAAIYARKSTEQHVADDQKSVARQVAHAREYAARKGWTVDDACIFVDDGISGAEFSKRPGFLRLMNALKPRSPFQTLIVSELSRVGREQLETGYALKQLSEAGVRIYTYMDDREVALDTATDVFLVQAMSYAATTEREKAAQRARDKGAQLARDGHVAGGRVFGYDNVEVRDAAGKRSHVARRINETEAAVIRQIFRLCAGGLGMKRIAKELNAASAPSPRAQRGRSQTWAPSSVREALFRDLYRGVITWNRTRKRGRFGKQHQTARPRAEWLTKPAPHLAIVTDDDWRAAHARLAIAREVYHRNGAAAVGGRPALGSPAKYLLTGLVACGRCGSGMHVRSWKYARNTRRFLYTCSGHYLRGEGVCTNKSAAPMDDANGILIDALLDDVLDAGMLRDAVEAAIATLQGDSGAERIERIDAQLADIDREHRRLMAAITAGRAVTGLLEALQALDARRTELESTKGAIASQRRLQPADVARARRELMARADSWRELLVGDVANARPIVAALLDGRVIITPTKRRDEWEMRGHATYSGLFTRSVSLQAVWRPHRDSNPGFSLERAAS